MHTNSVRKFGVFLLLVSSSAFATPELDALQQRCAAQEAKIRELESRLGIKPAPEIQAPVETTSTENTGTRWYEVQAGDTPERIARTQGCTVPVLLRTNGLKPNDLIRPGQKLKLPWDQKPTAPVPSSPRSADTPLLDLSATHEVIAGETLAAIARKHQIPLDQLLAANPDIKPTTLRIGTKLKLPAKPSSQASAKPEVSLPAAKSTMVLATTSTPAQPVAQPVTKIMPILIDQNMTYQQFAARQGTTIQRLNELNGLDLLADAHLAKGSELLAPHTVAAP